MAADVRDQVSPLPKFHFSIKGCQDTAADFHEAHGLPTETGTDDGRPGFHPIDIPGLGKVCKVVLREGLFITDSKIWDWYDKIKMNNIQRRTVVIDLLDAQGNTQVVWALGNAWPTKITGSDPTSETNEFAVKSIEIAYETLTITTP